MLIEKKAKILGVNSYAKRDDDKKETGEIGYYLDFLFDYQLNDLSMTSVKTGMGISSKFKGLVADALAGATVGDEFNVILEQMEIGKDKKSFMSIVALERIKNDVNKK